MKHSVRVVAMALGALAYGQGVRSAERLKLHETVKGELGPGEARDFGVEAERGQLVGVILRKKGLPAGLTVTGPGGETLLSIDSPDGNFGRVPVFWIAVAGGECRVRVTSSPPPGSRRGYELELTDLRPPEDRDRLRIEAQAAFHAAVIKDRASKRGDLGGLAEYEEAARALKASGDTYQALICLYRMGILRTEAGDHRKAIERYEEAATAFHESGEPAAEAYILWLESYPYTALGETAKSLKILEKAGAIYHAAGDRVGEARTMKTLAQFSEVFGEPQKSLDTYQNLLALARSLGDHSWEAQALYGLGTVYRDFGAEEKALDYFQRALAVGRGSGGAFSESEALKAMGDVYFYLGEKRKAVEFYEKSVEMDRAAGNQAGEAAALTGLANVYSDLANRQRPADLPTAAERQKAIEYYERSLAIGRATADPLVQSLALMGAGVAYSSEGDKRKAANYLNQALFNFSIARVLPGEGWARYEIARVERDQGNLENALTLARNARGGIESLRIQMISPEFRALFFAAVQECYVLEMDVLMRLHSADPSKNYIGEALTASERSRARVLLEMLGEAEGDIREGVDPELLEREKAIEVQLNGKEAARIQMFGARHTPEMAREIETAVRELASQYEEIHTRIRASNPHYAALRFPQPLSLAEIQRSVLDADTLLIEYALGTPQSYIWAVSADGIEGFALPARRQIEEAARKFHASVSSRDAGHEADAGKDLTRILLDPVASRLGNKRLLIVADGALQYLPFAALPDPVNPSEPLIARHEVVNAPSASTLAALRKEFFERPPAPKTLAIFADPVFSNDDSRIKGAARGPIGSPSQGSAAFERAAIDLGVVGLRLPRLPGTRREAAGIAALLPETERKQALDFDASREALMSPEIRQYRILHLATHGLLNTVHPELSGVVLSLVDRRGKPQDGFLRLHQIYNLKLQADLVVLSACQTGLGKEIQGEGLVGLTRGFMYAGSPRVLASLWKVDDRATSELMRRFYSAMLGSGSLRPAAALRAAQMEMWKSKDWASPYYWAAFTLQGEWR